LYVVYFAGVILMLLTLW